MNRKNVLASVLVFTLVIFIFINAVNALNITIPNVRPEMLEAEYWIEQLADADRVILNQDEINQYNGTVYQRPDTKVIDLLNYPGTLSKDELTAYLTSARFPTVPQYRNGWKVSNWYYWRLGKELNTRAVQEENRVRYGFTVRRTDMRAFPTQDRLFDTASDIEFDNFQNTAVDPAEALVILHQSRNHKWFFVQTFNCRGWLPVKDIAVAANREDWVKYLNEPDFLIVTLPQVRLGIKPFSPELSGLIFEMGARLPLAAPNEIPATVEHQSVDGNFVVKLPVRDGQGRLQFKMALLPTSSGVSIGYLPYTRANIIRQAFKGLGYRYGWGGMFDSMDCSAYVLNIYRTFGFKTPRNTSNQKQLPGKNNPIRTTSFEECSQDLRALQPGAMLHFPGHVMLYLGSVADNYYIIHCLSAYYDSKRKDPEGKLLRMNVSQVVVSDLLLTRASGKQYWECLTNSVSIEKM